MSTAKKRLLQYSITTGVCAIITFVLLIIKGVFNNPETKELMKYFTDSFFAVGIICAAFGLLVFASNGGAFDMLVYGVYRFLTLFKKNHTDVKYQTYYDYHIAKAERKKTEFLFMVIVGLLFVGISMIFLIFWYQY